MDAEPNFFADLNVINDPGRYFDLKRSQAPAAWEPHHNTLMVTGFDAVMEVLWNKEGVYSSARSVAGPIPPLPFQVSGSDIRAQLEAHGGDMPWAQHLVCFDGKKHMEHRVLLTNLLTPRRVKQNENYLRGLAERLIDGLIGKGACDIVPEYAHAVTTYAISDLLGIPAEDRAELLELIGAPPSQVEGDAAHKIGPDPLIFLKDRFDQYLRDRQENPRPDLMTELLQSSFRNGSRPDFDVVSRLARFLFGAGQDTTSRLIAMAILILAEDQEMQQHLRNEPERIADFIEEVLRYDSPVKVSYRLALADTKIGDVDVPAGTILTVCLSGASNDPDHFDNPHAFDINRTKLREHMAFGRGAHACPGAPLGRMETRIALERFLARTKNFRISEAWHGSPPAREYRFEPTYTFRSLRDLHIEFTAAEAL